MAPSALSLRIHAGNRFKLRLWLPVFILWPLALLLILIVAPLLLMAEAVSAFRGTPIHFFGMLAGVVSVLSSLNGTLVKVENPAKRTFVYVAIY